MANQITSKYTEFDRTVTYTKELSEAPVLDELFEAYLSANEAFTFQNDVTVNIHNPIFEDTIVEWDNQNGVNVREEEPQSDFYEDLLDSMLEAIGHMESKEKWYMGHRY